MEKNRKDNGRMGRGREEDDSIGEDQKEKVGEEEDEEREKRE